MNYIKSYIISTVISVYSWLMSWLRYEDFHIHSVQYVFFMKDPPENETLLGAWKNVSSTSNKLEYFYNITKVYNETEGSCVSILNDTSPTTVTYNYTELNYQYKDVCYTHFDTEEHHIWPVKINQSMHFTIPMTEAYIVRANGEIWKDVTNRVKSCLGPKKDFHGNELPMEWVVEYEMGFLEEENLHLEIKNMMGENNKNRTGRYFKTQSPPPRELKFRNRSEVEIKCSQISNVCT